MSAVCLGAGGWVDAQSPPPARVPPRPPDGVHDDARIFSGDQRRAAAQAIVEAKNDGVAVYLAAFTFIVDESIEARAERLKAAWCREKRGLIVVLDASTSRCTYLSHLSESDWLTSEQLRQILDEATAASVSKLTPGERLLSVVENLVPRIHSALESHQTATQRHDSSRKWMVFGAVVVACVVLLIVAWVGRRLGRRVQASRPKPAFFPTVAVEPRFGGAFAGGVAAELDFGGAGGDDAHSGRV